MTSPHIFSLKNPSMAISLSLLLLLLSFCGCYSCSFSSTLILLVLPTSFPFIFSKIKQLLMATSMEKPTPELKLGLEIPPEAEVVTKENKATQEGGEDLQTNGLVHSCECPLPDNDGPISDSSIANEKLESLDCNPLASSDYSVSDDEPLPEIVGSDGSISDDDSLIEITLEGEPNAVFHRELRGGFLPEFLPEISPELVFRQHGLMELLSEINEEDNMIEIDIAMGSIKCSRFEIKA